MPNSDDRCTGKNGDRLNAAGRQHLGCERPAMAQVGAHIRSGSHSLESPSIANENVSPGDTTDDLGLLKLREDA